MSLVNDMLRDLNKRTPVSNKAARVHSAFSARVEQPRRNARVGLVLAGGVLVGLLAGYFYYESMNIPTVQAPVVIAPRTPSAENLAPEPPQAPAIVAVAESTAQLAPADTTAIEMRAEFRELASQPDGFTLLIELSETTTFTVRERTASGIVLFIDGVDRYDRSGIGIPGMSLRLVDDGLEVGFALGQPTDFLVRENSETPNYDILITAMQRPAETLTNLAQPEAPVAVTEPPAAIAEPPAAPAATTNLAAQQPQATPPAAAGSERTNTAVRVARELSLEERDRNNSQSALVLVQGGRMAEALQQLLDFLVENPAAHQSRETLAKLLFAQQAFAQAGTVVDQGLEQVPNHAPFRKLKARLLMQDGEAVQALALLRNAPPAVAADTEYHELLATLYQQAGYHEQAATAYQDLLRTDRTQGRWWTGLGISLEAQDKNAEALASYQAALQSPNLDANLRRFVQNRISNLGSAR